MKKPKEGGLKGIIKKTVEHYFSMDEFLEHEGLGLNNLIPTTSIAKKFYKDGRVRETEYFYDAQPDYKTVYKYNRKKQLIKTIDFNPGNNPVGKSLMKYDSNGLCIKSCTYSDMNNIDFIFTYFYNENSQKISETQVRGDGSSDGKSYFEYGRGGKETIYTYKDNAGNIIEKFIELFDDAGNNVLSWICGKDDTLEREYLYSYDLHNNMLEKIFTSYSDGIVAEESRWRYKYVYDMKNNWTKVYSYHDCDEFSSVVIREIDYF